MTVWIDVWYGDIWTEFDLAVVTASVSAEELESANKIRHQQRQSQYLNTRFQIRSVLASYLGIEPAALEILKTEHGKPYLSEGGLFFNVSHSGSKLAVAVTDFAEIGVDIEQVRSRHSLQGVAERCFAEEELAIWRSLDGERQLQAFYRLWTAKEAYVKAVGRGIALGLDQCVIDPEQPGGFLRLPEDCGDAEAWRIVNFKTEADYCGALAIEAGSQDLQLQRNSFDLLLEQ